jgi:hemolysin activation/secretion protein
MPTAPPAPLQTAPGQQVTVKSVRFVGNTLLGTEPLAAVVQPYLNKPQSLAQLQEAADAVTQVYRQAGWVVRAYLPQQDLTDGVLTIQVIEAVFSGAVLDGPDSKRVDFAQITRIFNKQQAVGQPLNADALDRALLLADDLPGVSVSGSLVAGQKDGETGIALKLGDEALLTGDASADNTGARSTGNARASVNLMLNSALHLGDQASASAVHTEGSDYLRLGVSAPLGSNGWRVGGSASDLRYHIISPEFVALQSQGSSASVGLEASVPLLRSRSNNVYLSLNADHKTFHNESNATVQSDYVSRSTSVGLSGNSFDNWGGGGANSASLTWVSGNVGLGSLDAAENAALEGLFTKLRYTLGRQQVVTEDLSAYAALSGQLASQVLDSSEKFNLGGASGVRAYPSSEGSGSRGQLLNLELRWRVLQNMTLTGFYDWGSVANLDASPSYSLQGAGLGVSWQSAQGFNVKAVWAHRLGSNPNPTATGNDQDGSLSENRWWLTASLPF